METANYSFEEEIKLICGIYEFYQIVFFQFRFPGFRIHKLQGMSGDSPVFEFVCDFHFDVSEF